MRSWGIGMWFILLHGKQGKEETELGVSHHLLKTRLLQPSLEDSTIHIEGGQIPDSHRETLDYED